tara:strand:- start:800 stop:1051 length:252 start_codon:yes stop_codon:yes gene_type:complete
VETFDGLVEISEQCYLDVQDHSLTIQFERVSITMHVEEFLDFYEIFDNARSFFINSEDYVFGETMSEPIKQVIIPKPSEDEYT